MLYGSQWNHSEASPSGYNHFSLDLISCFLCDSCVFSKGFCLNLIFYAIMTIYCWYTFARLRWKLLLMTLLIYETFCSLDLWDFLGGIMNLWNPRGGGIRFYLFVTRTRSRTLDLKFENICYMTVRVTKWVLLRSLGDQFWMSWTWYTNHESIEIRLVRVWPKREFKLNQLNWFWLGFLVEPNQLTPWIAYNRAKLQ